jgi:hypothetical protein
VHRFLLQPGRPRRISVAYVPRNAINNRWPKFDSNPLPRATTNYFVQSAVLVSAPPCSAYKCPANDAQYCTSNGELFKIFCIVYYSGSDLASLNLEFLYQCIDACSSGWPGVCNGVTFHGNEVPANANCYSFAVATEEYGSSMTNSVWSALTLNQQQNLVIGP